MFYNKISENFRTDIFRKLTLGAPIQLKMKVATRRMRVEMSKLLQTLKLLNAFKKCLTWMERQNNVEAIQLMQLRRMMELATRTRCRNLKQTDLLEHFRQK